MGCIVIVIMFVMLVVRFALGLFSPWLLAISWTRVAKSSLSYLCWWQWQLIAMVGVAVVVMMMMMMLMTCMVIACGGGSEAYGSCDGGGGAMLLQ